MHSIYNGLLEAQTQHEKKFAVLIDPDKVKTRNITRIIEMATLTKVDFFLLGGSLLLNNAVEFCIQLIKKHSNIPVVLFPGGTIQLSNNADAILLLSLISGRNPDLLIGRHVEAAPFLAKSNLEIMPTGYMLVDGGAPTSVTYMSNTFPIPANKNDIAVCTALAGELLGLKLLYMDAGSGAKNPISASMISDVRKHTSIPIFVGGGIRTPERAFQSASAGADVIVVGNAIEKDPRLVMEMVNAVHSIKPAEVKYGM